ncbi:histidine kinase [Novosphingobium sp. Rr 2-17]|nr:histidine kinase [Novosphingobium sp. Rr 2-17]
MFGLGPPQAVRRWFHSGRLFWKLFAAFSLATAASFLVGIGYVHWTAPASSLDTPALDKPVRVYALIQRSGPDAVRSLLAQDERDGGLSLYTKDGRWVAGARDISENAPPLLVTAPDGVTYRLKFRGHQFVAFDRIAPIIAGLLVSLVVSGIVAWYLARPLTHLTRGFRDVAAGNLATRLHPLVGRRRDEIADLTLEFDSMTAQLENVIATQERLLHDISHELRSPLARLEVAIGLLRQSPGDAPAMMARVEQEAKRLDQLIGELLTLARLKSGATDLKPTHIDVIDLLTAIIDDASFEAAAKQCEVVYTPPGSFVVMAEGETLYRAYENIIRNAIKYAPPKTAIDIEVSVRDDELIVEVTDRGTGVPDDLLAAIFEPFKRGDNVNETGVTGFGLGLAIADHAIRHHGGTIEARTAAEGGLAMRISLPRAGSINASTRTNLVG